MAMARPVRLCFSLLLLLHLANFSGSASTGAPAQGPHIRPSLVGALGPRAPPAGAPGSHPPPLVGAPGPHAPAGGGDPGPAQRPHTLPLVGAPGGLHTPPAGAPGELHTPPAGAPGGLHTPPAGAPEPPTSPMKPSTPPRPPPQPGLEPPPPQPLSLTPPPPSPPPSSQRPSRGSSSSKKAGIAIGVIFGAGIVGFAGFIYMKRRQNIRRAQFGYDARRREL